MKSFWIVAVILCVVAATAWSLAPLKGSAHIASGTTDFERIWKDGTSPNKSKVSNLSIAAESAAIEVIHYPHFANQDTFTIRSGDVMTWTNLNPGIDGFKVIRSSATVVDCYWW